MTATVKPTRSSVFEAIRAFILSVLDTEVVQGRDNLVAPIKNGVVITPLFQSRLSTNLHSYFDPVTEVGTETTTAGVRLTIQIDCYGPAAAEYATILSTLWRDEIACTAMGEGVQPLDADEASALSFTSPDDAAFVPRWMITARLQYNPEVVTPMEFFDQAGPVKTVADVVIPSGIEIVPIL